MNYCTVVDGRRLVYNCDCRYDNFWRHEFIWLKKKAVNRNGNYSVKWKYRRPWVNLQASTMHHFSREFRITDSHPCLLCSLQNQCTHAKAHQAIAWGVGALAFSAGEKPEDLQLSSIVAFQIYFAHALQTWAGWRNIPHSLLSNICTW